MPPSSRNVPGVCETGSTMSDILLPPTAVDDSWDPSASPVVPHPGNGYGEYNHGAPLLGEWRQSQRPYRHRDVAAPLRWVQVVLQRLRLTSERTTSCRADWLPTQRSPGVSHALRSGRYVWSLACHGPWDWGPWPLPQRGFVHRSIDTLPRPLQPLQLVIDGQCLGPQSLEDARTNPLGEVIVHCAGRPKALPGHSLPLDARAQHVEDAFRNAPKVDAAWPSQGALAGWNQWLHPLPHRIWQFPRAVRTLLLSHRRPFWSNPRLCYQI